ncbi:MAG: GNAT family N-acetyltransferase [Anaerolineae bacterium]
MIDIHILHTIAELEAAVDVEVAVWGLNPRNAVPSALMHVLTLRGGLVLGAYDGDQMVGILLALPARDGNDWILWSHMTGVIQQYQGLGIGLALKRFQRQWALENGYRAIRWTVDPLQRGNAHFNFHLLGEDAALITRTYHVDFYGEMDDDINRGIPSDRIEAEWQIDQPCLHTPIDLTVPSLLSPGDDLHPIRFVTETQWDSALYRASIPRSLEVIRSSAPGGVFAWRLALREALQAAFARGYAIVDFYSSPDAAQYILKRTGDAQ